MLQFFIHSYFHLNTVMRYLLFPFLKMPSGDRDRPLNYDQISVKQQFFSLLEPHNIVMSVFGCLDKAIATVPFCFSDSTG